MKVDSYCHNGYIYSQLNIIVCYYLDTKYFNNFWFASANTVIHIATLENYVYLSQNILYVFRRKRDVFSHSVVLKSSLVN